MERKLRSDVSGAQYLPLAKRALRVAKLPRFEKSLGFTNGLLFVNSAQCVARDSLGEYLILPNGQYLPIAFSGCVDARYVAAAVGLNPIFGRAALRTWLQRQPRTRSGKIARSTAKTYVAKLARAGVLKEMHTDSGVCIPWALERDLKDWLEQHFSRNRHTRAGRPQHSRVKAMRYRPEDIAIVNGTIQATRL